VVVVVVVVVVVLVIDNLLVDIANKRAIQLQVMNQPCIGNRAAQCKRQKE